MRLGEADIQDEDGVEIEAVVPDGPAGHVGLRAGDRLVRMDGRPVGTEDDINAYLFYMRPGEVVTLTVRRKGQVLETQVVLEVLTPAQIREAAEYGETLLWQGLDALAADYTAQSGDAEAVLYTEFTYVARRVLSALSATGPRPSDAFERAAADAIRGQVEVVVEMNGPGPGFLDGAAAVLRQGALAVPGRVVRGPGYAVSPEGTVPPARLASGLTRPGSTRRVRSTSRSPSRAGARTARTPSTTCSPTFADGPGPQKSPHRAGSPYRRPLLPSRATKNGRPLAGQRDRRGTLARGTFPAGLR